MYEGAAPLTALISYSSLGPMNLINLRTLYNILYVAAVGGIIYSGELIYKSRDYFKKLEDGFIGPFAVVVEIVFWGIILLMLNWLRHTLADSVVALYRDSTEGPEIDLSSGDMTGQLLRQARKMEKKKDFAGAAEVYETLEEWEKAGEMHSLAEQWVRAGVAFERGANLEAAISCYEREGEFEMAGEAALRDGRRGEAVRLFRLAAEKAIDANRLQRAGELYEKGGMFDKAGELFQTLNRADDALRCYEKANNPDKLEEVLATIDYESFLRRVSTGIDLFRRVAENLARNDRFSRAAEVLKSSGDLQRSAEFYNKSGDYLKAAQCYFEAGQLDGAEDALTRVTDRVASSEFRAKLAADRGDWMKAGEFYEKANKPQQAVDAYKKCKAFSEAARVLQHQGRLILAAEMYSMAKDFVAAGEAYLAGRDARNAGECFETGGDLVRAMECYLQAGMFLQAGIVAFQARDFAKSIDSLQRVAGNSQDFRLAQGWLAAAFMNVGRYDLAGEIFRRLMEDLSPARDTLAIFYWYARHLEQTDPHQALIQYKVILGLEAGFEDVSMRVAKLDSQTGWGNTSEDGAAPSSGPAAYQPPVRPSFHSQMTEPYEMKTEMEHGREPVLPEPPSSSGGRSSSRFPSAVPFLEAAVETLSETPVRGAESGGGSLGVGYQSFVGPDNRFRIIEDLGPDYLVKTMVAEDRETGRVVLLRLITMRGETQIQSEKLLDEGRAISRLAHPNIQAVYSCGRSGNEIFLAQERIEGETLLEQVRRQGPYNPRDLGNLLLQLADSLSYAHSQAVIHRGLKPTNLVLRSSGNLKVLNFGLDWMALSASGLPGGTTEAPAGPPVGDPAYLAPEQVTGQPLDVRTDMYSLGLILFVLATGRNPFEIRKLTDPLEIARMQVSSGFPMPSTIRATLPESVDSLFVKCTKKNPAERYGSADEFLEEVKVALLQ